VAAGFGIGAFAVRMSTIVPNPRSLFEDYAGEAKARTLASLAATRVQAFESNDSKHKKKARRWWISLVFLAAGMTLMLASIVVHTGDHVRSPRHGQPAARPRPGSAHGSRRCERPERAGDRNEPAEWWGPTEWRTAAEGRTPAERRAPVRTETTPGSPIPASAARSSSRPARA